MSAIETVSTAVRLIAYHNDPALKREVLSRVETHRAAGEIVPGPGFWDGNRGSLVGVSVHSRDAEDFEVATGIAKGGLAIAERIWSLALLRLWLHREAWEGFHPTDIESLRAFPGEWLEKIAPGCNTDGLTRRMTISVLTLVLDEAEAHPDLEGLGELLRTLIDGHEDSSAKAAASWREWRKSASALARAHREGTLQSALANLVATAAWPDTSSAGALPDVLEQYVNLCHYDARDEVAWTGTEEETKRGLDAQRERILLDPASRETTALRDFDDKLKNGYPVFAKRRTALEEARSLHTVRRLMRLRGIFLGLLSDAVNK